MEFADFIAPFDAREFRSECFGKRPVHIHGDADRAGLLPWPRFHEVLAITPYWNEEALTREGGFRACLPDARSGEELRGDLEKPLDAGALVETEMR